MNESRESRVENRKPRVEGRESRTVTNLDSRPSTLGSRRVAAVVLAAGLSRRMGQPKMVLPWGKTTIIGHVVSTLQDAGVDPIVVVTGGARDAVETALASLGDTPVLLAYNPEHARGDMHTSLQVGLRALPANVQETLVVLGDQPRIQTDVVRQVIAEAEGHPERLIVPSYQMRRGHPWLLPRSFWPDVLALSPPQTMRDFLQSHTDKIHYVNVDTPSIIQDMDTPEDYQRALREAGLKPE